MESSQVTALVWVLVIVVVSAASYIIFVRNKATENFFADDDGDDGAAAKKNDTEDGDHASSSSPAPSRQKRKKTGGSGREEDDEVVADEYEKRIYVMKLFETLMKRSATDAEIDHYSSKSSENAILNAVIRDHGLASSSSSKKSSKNTATTDSRNRDSFPPQKRLRNAVADEEGDESADSDSDDGHEKDDALEEAEAQEAARDKSRDTEENMEERDVSQTRSPYSSTFRRSERERQRSDSKSQKRRPISSASRKLIHSGGGRASGTAGSSFVNGNDEYDDRKCYLDDPPVSASHAETPPVLPGKVCLDKADFASRLRSVSQEIEELYRMVSMY